MLISICVFVAVTSTILNFKTVTAINQISKTQKSATAQNSYYFKSSNKLLPTFVSSKPNITLSTIEDIEMLTYFLLWKHDYFDNAPDLNSIQSKWQNKRNAMFLFIPCHFLNYKHIFKHLPNIKI